MNDFLNDITNSRAVRLVLVVVLGLLALFLLALSINAFDRIGRPGMYGSNTITVTGQGRATATPDIARITYTVMETAPQVADAQKKATERNDAALAAIKELGVDEDDVRTLSYSVSPQYDYNQGRVCMAGFPCPPSGSLTPSGYQVTQSIEIKVRDTAKASDVLGKLGSLGVQNIYGPEFTVDEPEAVKAEARAEAIEKAREQAKDLAKELGVGLGKVVNFSDSTMPYYAGYGGAMMDSAKAVMPAANPTLPAGQSEYVINVTIMYEIR